MLIPELAKFLLRDDMHRRMASGVISPTPGAQLTFHGTSQIANLSIPKCQVCQRNIVRIHPYGGRARRWRLIFTKFSISTRNWTSRAFEAFMAMGQLSDAAL